MPQYDHFSNLINCYFQLLNRLAQNLTQFKLVIENMETQLTQNDSLSKNKELMIKQLMNTIEHFYKNFPGQSVPQQVKKQVIPMLIDAYFKDVPNQIDQSERQHDKKRLLTEQKNGIQHLSKTIIIYLSLQSILRRNKVQLVKQMIFRRQTSKKMLRMLLKKSMKQNIKKIINKFILNGRLAKLQLEGVKVIANLFKRKKYIYSKHFMEQARLKLDVKNPQIYNDLHLIFQSLYIKRMIEAFKLINKTNTKTREAKQSRILNSIALRTPLIVQSSLWRLKRLATKRQNITKICSAIEGILLRASLKKILQLEYSPQTEIKSSIERKANKVKKLQNKQNILIQIASNVLENKIFQRKLESFISIEKATKNKKGSNNQQRQNI